MGSGSTGFGATPRKLLAVLTALLLVLAGFGNVVDSSPAAAQETQVPYGDVIVMLEDGVDPSLFASGPGVEPAFIYDTLITGFAANLTPEAARRLAQVPQVVGIFPDLPVDPTVQIIPTGVERVNAPRNPFQPFTNGRADRSAEPSQSWTRVLRRWRTSTSSEGTTAPPTADPGVTGPMALGMARTWRALSERNQQQ